MEFNYYFTFYYYDLPCGVHSLSFTCLNQFKFISVCLRCVCVRALETILDRASARVPNRRHNISLGTSQRLQDFSNCKTCFGQTHNTHTHWTKRVLLADGRWCAAQCTLTRTSRSGLVPICARRPKSGSSAKVAGERVSVVRVMAIACSLLSALHTSALVALHCQQYQHNTTVSQSNNHISRQLLISNRWLFFLSFFCTAAGGNSLHYNWPLHLVNIYGTFCQSQWNNKNGNEYSL